MNIHNLKSTLSRPDAGSRRVENAGAQQASTRPAHSGEPDASQPLQDRVELSAEALAAHEAAQVARDEAAERDLPMARHALLGMPPLDPERMDHILQRVQAGFYSQPDVLKQVAEKIVSDLPDPGRAGSSDAA